MLRFHGCKLPIQWWVADESEVVSYMPAAAREVNASIQDCSAIRKKYDHPRLGGWQRKPYSILHSPFVETLLLDADNFVVRDPTYLFDDPEYLEHGSLFWPDIRKVPAHARIWHAAGIKPDPDGYNFQGGQQIVNMAKCRFEMMVTMDLNFDSDYWYWSRATKKGFTYGEQDLYRIAWRMLGSPYGIIPVPVGRLKHTLIEFDRLGRRVFQHRINDKFAIDREPVRIPDFWFEDRCRGYLAELRAIISHDHASDAARGFGCRRQA
jgi:alpha 1,2-mannosyltransferase